MNVEQPFPESEYRLEPGVVQVFHISLDLPARSLPDCLSPEEQARAARLRIRAHQRRFVAAHTQVRMVLARFANQSAQSLVFTAGPRGKPALPNHLSLQFNLSHSHERALLAVCLEQAVGIDIERLRENLDRDGIARRFFSPLESNALFALPTEQQPAAFMACWTRKEAYIKARGLGLAIPLDSFSVTVLPGEAVKLINHQDEPGGANWSIYEIDPGPGYAAALAVEGEITGIQHHSFRLPQD